MTAQPDLWSQRKVPQIVAVHAIMQSGKWYTFQTLRDSCFIVFNVGISEAGVSARIRDLRKEPYNLMVERRQTPRPGVWEYRVIL